MIVSLGLFRENLLKFVGVFWKSKHQYVFLLSVVSIVGLRWLLQNWDVGGITSATGVSALFEFPIAMGRVEVEEKMTLKGGCRKNNPGVWCTMIIAKDWRYPPEFRDISRVRKRLKMICQWNDQARMCGEDNSSDHDRASLSLSHGVLSGLASMITWIIVDVLHSNLAIPKEYDVNGGANSAYVGFEKNGKMYIVKTVARGRVAAMAISWKDFKALMVEEFCPSNEMEKLENELWKYTRWIAWTIPTTTIQTAILRARILTDKAVSCGTLTKNSDKRKGVEEPSKTGGFWKDNKKAKTGMGLFEAPVRQVAPVNDVRMSKTIRGVLMMCGSSIISAYLSQLKRVPGQIMESILVSYLLGICALYFCETSIVVTLVYVENVADGHRSRSGLNYPDCKLELWRFPVSINLDTFGVMRSLGYHGEGCRETHHALKVCRGGGTEVISDFSMTKDDMKFLGLVLELLWKEKRVCQVLKYECGCKRCNFLGLVVNPNRESEIAWFIGMHQTKRLGCVLMQIEAKYLAYAIEVNLKPMRRIIRCMIGNGAVVFAIKTLETLFVDSIHPGKANVLADALSRSADWKRFNDEIGKEFFVDDIVDEEL
ncbi:hypothetical protein Tco_0950434 [Tanacetum coccineum]